MTWTTTQQNALLNVIQRRAERDMLQKQLAQTKAELGKRQHEQDLLRTQWQREQADVDRLTRLSWASVYYDLINRKEQQMSQEEVEAQQARLRYDVVCARVDELQQQRDNQERRLTEYTNVDADYDQFIREKRLALLSSSDGRYEQYQQQLDRLTQHNQYVQELNEAFIAGRTALDEVIRLEKLLDQARQWGQWDMLGGSAFSSMLKYGKLDDVREQSYQVTHSLQQFRAEYADLRQTFMADWQVDDNLTRFVDIFFDNIFTDWSVQSRINKAQQTAQALENQLVTTLQHTKTQLEQAVEQTKQQADEFQRFLERA